MEIDLLLQKIAFPNHLFGKFIRVLFRNDGTIEYLSGKWESQYHSMVEELQRAGNVFHFFTFKPFESPSKIPGLLDWDDAALKAAGQGTFRNFLNHREFGFDEDPEKFYTTLPTAKLMLYCRCPGDRFFGLVSVVQTPPRIYPSRPSGILYVEDGQRLVGFNRTFFEFFQSAMPDPAKLLGQPLSDFLSPTPAEIERREISRLPPPDTKKMRECFSTADASAPALVVSHPHCFRQEAGLRAENNLEDPIFAQIPLSFSTREDFLLEVEAETLSGAPPLFVLGQPCQKDEFPDIRGYLVGLHPESGQWMLKRKSIVRRLGNARSKPGKVRYALRKNGTALFFSQDGEEILRYFDHNFLHREGAVLLIGLRMKSAVHVHSLTLSTGPGNPRVEAATPTVRLNAPEQGYFILNELNQVELASSFPRISAYLLENVTDLQQRMDLLEHRYRELLIESGQSSQDFVGQSPLILAIKKRAAVAAASDATILIEGETGTGKEVLAQYLHRNSRRRESPMIKVDCSTLPRELMESELFGHEKGSFTGAVDRKIGHFERAEKGTLFLDEVGNLTLETQAKLLQFLQDRTIVRLGGSRAIPVDARVVVASNLPLTRQVERGLFRADLYYRMEVVTITLPPLRERREDLPDLCQHFIRQLNAAHHKKVTGLTPQLYEKLFAYAWPGNIRELKNTLERAVIFSDGKMIGPESVVLHARAEESESTSRRAYHFLKSDLEEIRALFQKHRGVARDVAKELNVSIRTLYNAIKKSGATMEQVRGTPSSGPG